MTLDLIKLGTDCKQRFLTWGEDLRTGLDRELRLLQVGYQDQAFLATTKGAAYRHLEAGAQRMADPVRAAW